MKRVLSVILFAAVLILLTACGKGVEAATVPLKTARNAGVLESQPVPNETPLAVSTEVSSNVQQHSNTASQSLSFAHAPKVYADPDAYKGKTYESLFKVLTPKQSFEGKEVYFASGYMKGSVLKTYTVLDFKDGKVPDLAPDEIVYAYGVIEGSGFTMNEAGGKTQMLWLTVTGLETDAAKQKFEPQSKQHTFKEGQFIAKNGPLSIEIFMLDFKPDGLILATKTVDSSVKAKTTYYFDIVLHQDGFFAWYNNCNFWVAPNGVVGYDSVPFPALDSTKAIKADFVPYGEDGKLLYEPLSIDIGL